MKTKLESRDKVSAERWNRAQEWEKNFWVECDRKAARYGKFFIWKLLRPFGFAGKYVGDRQNRFWTDAFDGYSFLPPEIGTAIEAGCGPHTNMRRISEVCRPRHLFLSDPLIRTYVGFKNCYVSDAYKNGFCTIDDFPLENTPYKDAFFDMAVMINVLDHVMDATLCMENIQRIVKPGGWLLVAQDLTDENDVRNRENEGRAEVGDTGHPITLAPGWFDKTLVRAGYDAVIDKIVRHNDGAASGLHCGTLVFAGRKK